MALTGRQASSSNGRAAVSKSAGWGFESLLACFLKDSNPKGEFEGEIVPLGSSVVREEGKGSQAERPLRSAFRDRLDGGRFRSRDRVCGATDEGKTAGFPRMERADGERRFVSLLACFLRDSNQRH